MVKVRFQIGEASVEAEYYTKQDAEKAARALGAVIAAHGTEEAFRAIYNGVLRMGGQPKT